MLNRADLAKITGDTGWFCARHAILSKLATVPFLFLITFTNLLSLVITGMETLISVLQPGPGTYQSDSGLGAADAKALSPLVLF